jgi:hypothetical protein
LALIGLDHDKSIEIARHFMRDLAGARARVFFTQCDVTAGGGAAAAEDVFEASCGTTAAFANHRQGRGLSRVVGGEPSPEGAWPWLVRPTKLQSRFQKLKFNHLFIHSNLS